MTDNRLDKQSILLSGMIQFLDKIDGGSTCIQGGANDICYKLLPPSKSGKKSTIVGRYPIRIDTVTERITVSKYHRNTVDRPTLVDNLKDIKEYRLLFN